MGWLLAFPQWEEMRTSEIAHRVPVSCTVWQSLVAPRYVHGGATSCVCDHMGRRARYAMAVPFHGVVVLLGLEHMIDLEVRVLADS